MTYHNQAFKLLEPHEILAKLPVVPGTLRFHDNVTGYHWLSLVKSARKSR